MSRRSETAGAFRDVQEKVNVMRQELEDTKNTVAQLQKDVATVRSARKRGRRKIEEEWDNKFRSVAEEHDKALERQQVHLRSLSSISFLCIFSPPTSLFHSSLVYLYLAAV